MKRKRRRGDEPDVRTAWMVDHGHRCAACHAPAGNGVTIQCHHLLGGANGRIDDPRGFLAMCFSFEVTPRCHDLAGNERIRHPKGGYWPALPLAVCLALKLESDPENFDVAWLEQAYKGGRLPSPLPLPYQFYVERRRYEPAEETGE